MSSNLILHGEEMKQWYILYKDWDNIFQALSDEDAGKLLKKISAYQNGIDLSFPWSVDVSFLFIKNEFERNEKKYAEFVEKQSSNGKRWWRPKVQSQEKPKKPKPLSGNPNKPNESLTDTDTVTDIKSTNVDNIQKLIGELKKHADKLGVAYDKNKDWQFAKHILSAKEFWLFAEKIWQGRELFAKNIMEASISINYWKWPCSWPMAIYQNYADVYNRTKLFSKGKQDKSRVATLPWV